MATFKHIPTNGQKGKITYNAGIVSGIVSLAVSEVDGVALLYKNKKSLIKRGNTKKEGVKINFEKDGIYVDVSIKVYYGYNVPDIAFKIQQNIKHNVEAMSEFKIANVDVHVFGIIFQEEIAE
jgi:uncharacterized alkaline shock family protein YloU